MHFSLCLIGLKLIQMFVFGYLDKVCLYDRMFLYFNILILSLKWTNIESLSSCRDENNNLLDWFVLYKIPSLKDHSNPLIRDGLAYAFISSANDDGWVLSERSINSSSSMPGLTLAPIYEISPNSINEDNLFVIYNDQPPNGSVSFTGGHTKGSVYAELNGGFWLIHSVPHYPPLPQDGQYSYPVTGLKNGQSYLCMTLHYDQMDGVGTQLMYYNPHIYSSSVPEGLQKVYPTLSKAALGDIVNTPPWYHMESLVSGSGVTFKAFAKSPKFNKDLYSGWVSAALEVDLLVETWPNGVGHLSSYCHGPFRVENIEGVTLHIVHEAFSSHKDHSKWAISETKNEPWVCIGDINRATTQAIRGGGTVCTKNLLLWQAYHNAINSTENCPKQRHNTG